MRITGGRLIHLLELGAETARCGAKPGLGVRFNTRPTRWVDEQTAVSCQLCVQRASSNYGKVAGDILRALKEYGPMTRTEVCVHLGLDRTKAAAILTRLCRIADRPHTGTVARRRARIAGWVRDQEGERDYLRAQYGLAETDENGKDVPDVPKPSATSKSVVRAVKARYRERKAGRVSSVFDLGLTRAQLRARNQTLKGAK